jgi:hypothetical protein
VIGLSALDDLSADTGVALRISAQDFSQQASSERTSNSDAQQPGFSTAAAARVLGSNPQMSSCSARALDESLSSVRQTSSGSITDKE